MQFKLALGILALSIAGAQAADTNYYTISSVETHEIPALSTANANINFSTSDDGAGSLGDTLGSIASGNVSIGQIVNLGKELWSVIEANKPVVNVKMDTANALPKGITEWQQLAGWQAPQAHTYQTTLKNVYGMTVVSFQYRVSYTAGGSYRGAGKYLTNVAVAPQDLYVAWGYTFNATASVPSITNAGTERAPVAGAQILVKWSIDTVMAHSEQSAGYYMSGDGSYEALQ